MSLCWYSLISAPLLTRSTKYGVPQGFCLGSLLFSINTSEFFYENQSPLAFDTLLCRCHAIVSCVQTCRHSCPGYRCLSYEGMFADIRQWMIKDKLIINDEKTEFMMIGTKAQLSKVHQSCLTVDINQ